jgi:CRISPR-associated protein Cmr2
MSDSVVYTAVTFAPVQGFIEKSRKLRDLYGSSYLLSFIAQSVCLEAETQGCDVISPALPDITQGLPNQIIIEGQPGEENIHNALMKSWQWIVKGCQEWIQDNISSSVPYSWNRDWNLWSEHTWEFFYVEGRSGESISQVRQRLNEAKRQRAWTGINWQGESSTLSGADAVAYPDLANVLTTGNSEVVKAFYTDLSYALGAYFAQWAGMTAASDEQIREYGASFIDPKEELSIPELVKRLITHQAIIDSLKARRTHSREDYEAISPQLDALQKVVSEDFKVETVSQLKPSITQDLQVSSFRELNRKENSEWTGWFMGDGDGASDYLKWVGQQPSQVDPQTGKTLTESDWTQLFSEGMRDWGKEFKGNKTRVALPSGRVIYAGGDDFLGVLYQKEGSIAPRVCLQWLAGFQSRVWNGLVPWKGTHGKITASVGFVWASPQVPQRDVLQHARSAESSAKKSGKDRVAIRVLFAGGNHLEWVCPWRILEEGLFEKYRDRNGVVNALDQASWAHFYNDVAVLESRHAFGATMKESTEVAIALMRVYFPDWEDFTSDANYWNEKNEYKVTKAGILGNRSDYQPEGSKDINAGINEWVINLAKVGFYLCSNT